MKKARAAEAQLRSLTLTYGVVPGCVRAVPIACIQAVALNGSKLWWDAEEGSWWVDLQRLLYREARSTVGALPATPRGTLRRDSGLTPAAVALDTGKQWFMGRLPNACEGSKLKELIEYPTPGAPVGRVPAIEYARGKSAETMCWTAPGEKPAVKTTILEDDTKAKRAA